MRKCSIAALVVAVLAAVCCAVVHPHPSDHRGMVSSVMSPEDGVSQEREENGASGFGRNDEVSACNFVTAHKVGGATDKGTSAEPSKG